MTPEEIEQDIERTRRDMTDTLNQIQDRLNPRRLMGQAAEGLRNMGGGESSGARLLTGSALPLALLGIGAGWLLYSSMRGESGASSRPSSRLPRGATGAAGHYPPQSGYGASSEYGAEEGAERYGYGRPSQAYPGAELEEWREESGEEGGARERARQAARRARERGSQLAEQGRAQMRDVASQVGNRSRETFEQYPLAIGAVALLAGAALGAMLPRTRREDELMGPTSEELAQRARLAGQETWQRAERVATTAGETARREADELMRQAKSSAREIGETTKEEAERQDWTEVPPGSRTHH